MHYYVSFTILCMRDCGFRLSNGLMIMHGTMNNSYLLPIVTQLLISWCWLEVPVKVTVIY